MTSEAEGFDDETADKVLGWFADALGVEDWTPCDGTETWDGDVRGTIYSILKEARVWNDEDGSIARHPTMEAAEEIRRLREALLDIQRAAAIAVAGKTVAGEDRESRT